LVPSFNKGQISPLIGNLWQINNCAAIDIHAPPLALAI
jgi:hypothetical protein